MGIEASLKDEKVLTALLVITMAFIFINVSAQVGAALSFFVLAYYITILTPSVREVQVYASRQNIVNAAAVGAVAFVLWLQFVSFASKNLFAQSVTGFTDTIVFLKSQTTIPILANDPLVKFVIYGQLFPLAESMFFLSFALILAVGLLKVPLAWNNRQLPKILWASAMVGAVGSLFHVSTRQLSETALVFDFVFFASSALLVFLSTKGEPFGSVTRQPSMLAPLMLHVFVNSSVMAVS